VTQAFASILTSWARLLHCFALDVQLLVIFVHGAESFFAESFPEIALGTLLFEVEVAVDGWFLVVKHNFFVNELFVFSGSQRVKLEIEIKSTDYVALRLIFFEMQVLHVRMGESFLDRDSL